MVSDLFLQKWKYWKLQINNWHQIIQTGYRFLPFSINRFACLLQQHPFLLAAVNISQTYVYYIDLRVWYWRLKTLRRFLKWLDGQLVVGYFHLNVQMTFDLSAFFFKAVAFTGVVGFGAKQSNSCCVQMHTHSFCLFSL